jgi:predicted amidohydrolase YtcJ
VSERSNVVIDKLTVWSGSNAEPKAGWIWVEGQRIREVGQGRPPSGVFCVERQGWHALPGLVDAHRHFLMESFLPVMVDASSWQSKTDALEAVAHAVQRGDPQQWLVFYGMDHTKWQRGWAPTRRELDHVSGGRAVLLCDITLHRGVLSSEGFKLARLDPGDFVDELRDVDADGRGRPTGMVWERAFGRALSVALGSLVAWSDRVGRNALMQACVERLFAQGYVHIHDIGLSTAQQVMLAEFSARSPMKLSWSQASARGLFDPPSLAEDSFIDSGAAPRSVKFFLDGAHRCAICLPVGSLLRATANTAFSSLRQQSWNPFRALLEPEIKVSKGHVHMPYLRFGQTQDLVRLAAPYIERGYRLRIHALGNVAAKVAADVVRELDAGDQSAIEHIIALAPAEIEHVAASGAVASLQPGFIPHYAESIEQQGVLPYLLPFPMRSLKAAGVRVALSSDSPCGPGDALHNLRCAVSRTAANGRKFGEEEALTPSEAVVAASMGALSALGVESKGIFPGEFADMALCSGDPFHAQTTVTETWVDGTSVWAASAIR